MKLVFYSTDHILCIWQILEQKMGLHWGSASPTRMYKLQQNV